MPIIQMAQRLKQIHPEAVMMYKAGSFYHCYGKDLLKKNIKIVKRNYFIN